MTLNRRLTLPLLAAVLAGCASAGGRAPGQRLEDKQLQVLTTEFRREPEAAPARWLGLIGEYGPDTTKRWYVLERDQRLWVLEHLRNFVPLSEESDSVFQAPDAPVAVAGEVRFRRDLNGRGTAIKLGDLVMPRRNIEPAPGEAQLKITPLRPIADLRREALAASPPVDNSASKSPELVEIARKDTTIRLDIRYATSNNFLGAPVYEHARAFLQEPVADALVKVNRSLKPFGYGLMVHDAYRPWYVTRIFWDATPEDKRWLVANPDSASKHNRGAAVDLTLYELESGNLVEMPSTYDETTDRAHADYPGGTARQRWHRALLRRAMEQLGFVANPQEWWHFDYKDWKKYPIMNVPFESLGR